MKRAGISEPQSEEKRLGDPKTHRIYRRQEKQPKQRVIYLDFEWVPLRIMTKRICKESKVKKK